MQSTPIAYAFVNRDREFAIRLFNKYNGIDVFDAKAEISLSELRSAVFGNSGDWAQEKPKPTDGLIQKLAKTRCACEARKFDDGLETGGVPAGPVVRAGRCEIGGKTERKNLQNEIGREREVM